MEGRLKLRLVGLGGPIATLNADRTWAVADVQEAMVSQCQLPGWQYKLINGVNVLYDLSSLTFMDADPETGTPIAEITVIRQSNPDHDSEALLDAVAHGKTAVLQFALTNGFELVDAINKKGAKFRTCLIWVVRGAGSKELHSQSRKAFQI